ncbi:VRR-NUC domain-containing protein [Vibrio ouci]|uniref:phosphodiesterase I n=1 Tax=Vibrio ouci TaxID=2499078 RepID=A0A4Y8WCC9_9VIBR|nr:VRR-NUC domain-containing protein [Vibrio ouci]TFH90562.1 VRR-NUC domain-containing protein [Vibrio ouci]
MSDPIDLAADYYLNNFKKLTEHALDWYADFLSPTESKWLTQFDQLEHCAQCLLVRLLSRRGHWFRSDKLQYAEIPNLTDALKQLEMRGFIAINSTISEQDLGRVLLTKTELVSLFAPLNKSLRKEQLVAELSPQPYSDFDSLEFDVIELLSPNIISLLLTLFFANTHQDLSQFVLDDLGLHQFENYPLSKTRRFFTFRSDVDQLLLLADIQSQYTEGDRKDTHCLLALLESLPNEIEHHYIERKRQHLINDIARDLERLEQYEHSIYWFNQTKLPPAKERLARIYDKLNDIASMSDVVTGMLQHPHDIAELEVTHKLEQRLKRKQGEKVPREKKPVLSEYHLELDLSSQRVELAVKAYFEQQGYQVFYAENMLLNGLFGLAFWDAIFAPVEGAFINQYQHRPLDLYHSDFIAKRKEKIEEVLHTIQHDGFDHLCSMYEQKYGLSNPFVHWPLFSKTLLDACIESMPKQLIAELFKVMLQDLKLFRNGMPDLMLFKDGNYQWVEVKGPGDKLQDNQWRWITQFNRLDINFSVCYVKHREA